MTNEIQDNLIYKFYNINNELLYVGITNNIKLRIRQHKQDKEWASEIHKIYISSNMNRNEVHIYEIYYIANEFPKYNVDFISGGLVNLKLSEIEFKEYKKPKRKKININTLIEMYDKGMSTKDMSIELKYSPEYITQNLRSKLIELGDIKPNRRNSQNERLEIFINCLKFLSNKEYFTIEDIINEFMNDYGCAEETARMYYKDEFRILLDGEIEKLGWKRVRANKMIKEKYNINSNGYPFVICKGDVQE